MKRVTWHTTMRMLGGVALLASAAACTEKKPLPSEPVIVTRVAVVDVVPDTASIVVGQTRQFSALILDRSGNPVSAKTATWSSSNPTIAVVSSTGLMLAKGVGLVSISATADGRTGSAAVAVH
jgi:uncharacterized protein YjdB